MLSIRAAVIVGLMALSLPGPVRAQTVKTVLSNNTPTAIPAVGTATLYPSIITVAGVSGVTYHVTVTVKMTHTFPEDVVALLKAPNGKALVLFAFIGSSEAWEQRTVVFDDCAPRSVRFGFLASGRYRPGNAWFTNDLTAPAPVSPHANNLAEFNASTPNGNWELYIEDTESPDGGQIDSWSLTIFSEPAAAAPIAASSGVNAVSCSALDYDGDGRADIAVYRPQTGEWFAMRSGTTGSSMSASWGAPASTGNDDIAVPADYDGDGITDFAVYRRTTGDWWVLHSFDNSTHGANFGAPSSSGLDDQPVPADYDGDGRTDRAVYRATTGTWWILGSATNTYAPVQWGSPAAGDYPARR